MDCYSCNLLAGTTPLPGGIIHRTNHWSVQHCTGPLGLATLVLVPDRHVTSIADMSTAEAAELGPLLRQVGAVVRELVDAEQVYVSLWSHAGGMPGHIHYVVQPVTRDLVESTGLFGPDLQLHMLDHTEAPSEDDISTIAEQARSLFTGTYAR